MCEHSYKTFESCSLLTGKDLIDQTISLFSGTHFTLPTVVLNLGESASVGTGMWISTLLAVERLLNWLFAWEKKKKNKQVELNMMCCLHKVLTPNYGFM